jgi:hypothetical protein
MEGESEAATLQRMGFPVTFEGGNNQIAWVSLASIKYVRFKGGHFDDGADHDPRADQNLVKIVMHFVDGETMRSYKDDAFSQEAEGFNMRVWDPEAKSLMRVLVSLHALKAIFFVNEWDSRSEEERMRFANADELLAQEPRAAAEDQMRRSALHEHAQKQADELSPSTEA